VPPRVLHVSDLHFGTKEDPAVERALAALLERHVPDLLIASGDLTHRGRRAQHELAHAFLTRLGPPVHAVPGNHDIPYTIPARFTSPWREFERLWGTTEPVFRGDGLHVVGLNSVRPWRHQSGGVRRGQLRRVADELARAPEGALRIVVLHHQLLGAPWRSRKKPVADRSGVLGTLVDAGADLVLSGHIHQAAVSERHEFEVIGPAGRRAVVVSTAPGFGQPRPNRRGEARGLHVYDAADHALRIDTYIWRDDDWALTAVRTFPRGREPLSFEPAGP
jgi:3',5'-cyclic AMP phosphodiesterase CpdA